MITLTRRLTIFTFLLGLLAGPAQADKFAPMPGSGAANSSLQLRFDRYDGSTNGEMIVVVKNTGKQSQTFEAKGMFFVPEGDPEKAPQRLGAAGPIRVVTGAGKGQQLSAHKDEVVLLPGETKRLRLEVFCIDSHRSSPSPKTKFAVAKKLLPKKLRQEISAGARKIIRDNKGDVSKSKSEIQSHMWKTRDKAWIKIQGERKKEKK